MNRSNPIDLIVVEADLSRVASGNALDAIISAIPKTVSKEDAVTLIGSVLSSRRSASPALNATRNETRSSRSRLPRCRDSPSAPDSRRPLP